MRRNPTWMRFGLAAAIFALPAWRATADAEGALHGRVSFEAGGAMIKGQDDADWSYATINTLVLPGDVLWADETASLEVEFSGGTFVRLADTSRAEVVNVPPAGLIKAATGSFYIQRVNRSNGAFRVQTPALDVVTEPDSQVRVDVLDNGSTTVSVRWGRALVDAGDGTPISVTRGQRVYCDVGLLPSNPVAFDLSSMDAFDEWSRQRAEFIARGDVETPSKVRMSTTPVGYYELASQGEWFVVEGRQAWRPTVVADYSPYRYGYWSYVPAYGHCWVDNYSFSYVTSHYGRWDYHPHYGWCWYYRDGWGPAWVASVRYGSSYVWSPLNYYNAPVVCGSNYFNVGGLRFSITACSYAPVQSYYYGPGYTYAATPAIINNVHIDEVNIWNIHAPNYWRNYGNRPAYGRPVALGSGDLLRDYTPRRVIRGFDSVSANSPTARARAVKLESGVNAALLGGGGGGGVGNRELRSVRTSLASGGAQSRLRSPKIDTNAAQAVQLERSTRRAGASVSSIALRGDRVQDGADAPSTTRSLARTRGENDGGFINRPSGDAAGRVRSATSDVQGFPTPDRTIGKPGASGVRSRTGGVDEPAMRTYRTPSGGDGAVGRTTVPREGDSPRSVISSKPQVQSPSGVRSITRTPTERTEVPSTRGTLPRADIPGRATERPNVRSQSETPDVSVPTRRTQIPTAASQAPNVRTVTPRVGGEDTAPRSISRPQATAMERTPVQNHTTLRSGQGAQTRTIERPQVPARPQYEAPAPRSIETPSRPQSSVQNRQPAYEPRSIQQAPSTRSYERPQVQQRSYEAPAPRQAPSVQAPQRSIQAPQQRSFEAPQRSVQAPQRSFEAPSRSAGPSIQGGRVGGGDGGRSVRGGR